jgi:hypothetical protein
MDDEQQDAHEALLTFFQLISNVTSRPVPLPRFNSETLLPGETFADFIKRQKDLQFRHTCIVQDSLSYQIRTTLTCTHCHKINQVQSFDVQNIMSLSILEEKPLVKWIKLHCDGTQDVPGSYQIHDLNEIIHDKKDVMIRRIWGLDDNAALAWKVFPDCTYIFFWEYPWCITFDLRRTAPFIGTKMLRFSVDTRQCGFTFGTVGDKFNLF